MSHRRYFHHIHHHPHFPSAVNSIDGAADVVRPQETDWAQDSRSSTLWCNDLTAYFGEVLGWCTAYSGAILHTLVKCKHATAYWVGAYSGVYFAAEESSG